MIGALANHLWQSTLFAVAAGLLTVALRKNQAQVRFWMWFTASLKFFLPFSLLMSLGSLAPFSKHAAPPAIEFTMVQVVEPIPVTAWFEPPSPGAKDWKLLAMAGVWICGFAAIALIRLRGWQRIRAAVRSSDPLEIPAPAEVRSSPGVLEPGVVGFLRPMLLLPEGIEKRLTPPQLKAVLAHELCHVRRRDNLLAAIHMIVEAVFWFHPLVWWIGARLVEERERACDEEVLSLGSDPDVYAEGILNVCKLYVESPLLCVPGVTGSNLKKRIEAIMAHGVALKLNLGRKLLLAGAGMAAVAVPVAIGLMNAPPVRAQAPHAEPLEFEVASVKPSPPGLVRDNGGIQMVFPAGGRFMAANASLKDLVTRAYNLQDWQIFGGPDWAKASGMTTEDRFTVDAKAPGEASRNQIRAMLQSLLAKRFRLTVHRETRIQPVYNLVIAKNGPKLHAVTMEKYAGNLVTRCCRGGMYVEYTTMRDASGVFSEVLRQAVVDNTGLNGVYKFELHWTPEAFRNSDKADNPSGGEPAFDPDGPSIFTAVQKQLGLKLESAKGPVEVLVIDHAERPSEN